jgi:Predicted glutamine amidotransferases
MIGSRRPIRIGLSARIFHPEQDARGIRSKTLQVLEQSVAQWVMARGVLLLMVPSVVQDGILMRSNIRLRDYAENLDGLILQGGADVSPRAYGEEPLRPEWSGDPVRDAYELELLHEFMEARKPRARHLPRHAA